MFIRVEVDAEVAKNPEAAKKIKEVCPVDIYDLEKDGTLRIVEQNLDECTLCDLCVHAAPPGKVRIHRLYE